MKKLRIAYCEDESVQISYMEALINEWAKNNKTEYLFSGFKSAKEFLFENEDNYPFDVIFLDIDMEEIDGMKLARTIREKDTNLPIVFLTNRKEYVFEGYEVNAYRYLLKPINKEKLAEILRDIRKICSKEKRYIIEKQNGEFIKIDLDNIMYFEANGHYVSIHTNTNIIIVKKSLQEEVRFICDDGQTLFENGFVSTHRSFLVNLKYIDKVLKSECILSNEEKVPISRNAYKEVNEGFIRFYKEK